MVKVIMLFAEVFVYVSKRRFVSATCVWKQLVFDTFKIPKRIIVIVLVVFRNITLVGPRQKIAVAGDHRIDVRLCGKAISIVACCSGRLGPPAMFQNLVHDPVCTVVWHASGEQYCLAVLSYP